MEIQETRSGTDQMTPLRYCDNPFAYHRRKTREVKVGTVGVGGDNPIRVQTMLTTDTMKTDACVAESIPILKAGCEILRITAPAIADAQNLKNIVAELRQRGFQTPIVADIHFVPKAALEAANWVEKVRINPGNYADRKKFAVREYTDDQYADELARLEEAFTPLVLKCIELQRAMRIGTNHGSLSDRIMNRYGDTPLGMVESALEFARICRKHNYHDIIFSMKASNPKVMIEAYRLLVARLNQEGPDWNYPIHLGVTEAGEGEDGRIKSAIGIGALLEDGIGDTIRVSLTEDSVREIPVAQALVEPYNSGQLSRSNDSTIQRFNDICESRDPFSYTRRTSQAIRLGGTELGGEQPVRVCVTKSVADRLYAMGKPFGDTPPELIYEQSSVQEVDPLTFDPQTIDENRLVAVKNFPSPAPAGEGQGEGLRPIAAYRILAARLDAAGNHAPILLKDTFRADAELGRDDPAEILLEASKNIGALLCDGIGDAILVRAEKGAGAALRLSWNILQAAGCRSFKTDYVACPSCGRTLFDLQTVTARIKARTAHLKGVKIAVMGCVVNGPGEMADADFGYVGTAPGKISLYVGKTPVKHHLPEADAVEALVDLMKEHGKWMEPVMEGAKPLSVNA